MGLFKRVEVFALNVLNQGHGRRRLIGHIANQNWHLVQTRQSRCAETSFPRNDFILACIGAITQLANQDGLHDALSLDGLCQLIKSTLVHSCSRLVHAWHQLAQSQSAGGSIGCSLNGLWRARLVLNLGAQ